MKKVCLFGLSANPPHLGHVGIVKALSKLKCDDEEEEQFDEIRILPVYTHMFKEKRGNQASYQDRLEMCRLAFDGIPKVKVSDDEKKSVEKYALRNGM